MNAAKVQVTSNKSPYLTDWAPSFLRCVFLWLASAVPVEKNLRHSGHCRLDTGHCRLAAWPALTTLGTCSTSCRLPPAECCPVLCFLLPSRDFASCVSSALWCAAGRGERDRSAVARGDAGRQKYKIRN